MPYSEKAPGSQRHEEASIAKGQHPRALYNAAISRIGKLEPDIAYMNRKFKKYPKLAAESKKWYLKYRKKKGIYLCAQTNYFLHVFEKKFPNFFMCNKIHTA